MASWVSDFVLRHKITKVIFAKKHEVQVQYTRTCHFSTPPFIVESVCFFQNNVGSISTVRVTTLMKHVATSQWVTSFG